VKTWAAYLEEPPLNLIQNKVSHLFPLGFRIAANGEIAGSRLDRRATDKDNWLSGEVDLFPVLSVATIHPSVSAILLRSAMVRGRRRSGEDCVAGRPVHCASQGRAPTIAMVWDLL
jgi:hypothetical protein